MKGLLFATLVILSILACVRGEKDGWFVETDFTGIDPALTFANAASHPYNLDGNCQNIDMLYISSVLARNQTTDCFTTSSGSAMQVCDLTASPIAYYTETSTDVDCSTSTTASEVGPSYCLEGTSASALLTCENQNHKTVTPVHLGGATMLAGYAYFDGAKCKTADFFHAELASVTSCPPTYERMFFIYLLIVFYII
jgi:hypothetical protein